MLAASALLLLSACVTVPQGDPAVDARMKRFESAPGMTRIYIYRNETMGAAIKYNVLVDGRMIGATAAHTYLVAEVPPGPHTIASDGGTLRMIKVEAQPGKNLFIWQEMKMGFGAADAKLHVVSEAVGRKGVLETKLVGGL
ncbi:DUF2846 domain-containing protein [Pseudomonas sp. 2hn]|nr:DUF2846 domain-containing protein [Pseudomonas sp. 2hn]